MTLRDHLTAESPVAVLTRLQTALQGYALAITADHQLAEDTYQEVAAVVSSNPESVPAGPGALPWLREVTRRKALEVSRRARRGGTVLSLEVLEELGSSFRAREDSSLRVEALTRCVEELAPQHREILHGRYRDNLPAAEIAARAGRSVQGVYAVLKRVRGALLRCMRTHLPPAGGQWNEVM